MPSKRHPLRIAVIVEDIAREVNFVTRVTPHEAFAVHIGPATVPKGSSTETAALVEVTRPAVQLDDDYLIAIFPAGYKAFRRARDGRWTRQPEGWAQATERSLIKIAVNVFHAMMWRRLKERWGELAARDDSPWEEGQITLRSPHTEAWILTGFADDGQLQTSQQNKKSLGAEGPRTATAREAREESSGHVLHEVVSPASGTDVQPKLPAAKPLSRHEAVSPASGTEVLPTCPAAKPLSRRLARIRKS